MNPASNRPIVCATDFSPTSEEAANVAASLAIRLGTSLVLIHGVDERGEIPPQYWPGFMAADRPHLHEEATRVRQLGVSVEEELVGGAPEHGVVKRAAELQARWIVLGASGQGILERWVLGRTAERIAQSASVPTLVIHEAARLLAWVKGERPLKLFIGADFTAISDWALQWVAELREVGPCEITLGYVDHGPEQGGDWAVLDALKLVGESPEAQGKLEEELRSKAERWLGVVPMIVRVGADSPRIDERLLEMAREAEADLIVIGTHQWRGWNRLQHRSVSRQILHHARTNVACVPLREPLGVPPSG